MKKKIATREELIRLTSQTSKIFKEPPINDLNLPNGFMCYVNKISETVSLDGISVFNGTLTAIRLDQEDYPNVWNTDVYTFINTEDSNIFPIIVQDKNIIHKFNKLPENLISAYGKHNFTSYYFRRY